MVSQYEIAFDVFWTVCTLLALALLHNFLLLIEWIPEIRPQPPCGGIEAIVRAIIQFIACHFFVIFSRLLCSSLFYSRPCWYHVYCGFLFVDLLAGAYEESPAMQQAIDFMLGKACEWSLRLHEIQVPVVQTKAERAVACMWILVLLWVIWMFSDGPNSRIELHELKTLTDVLYGGCLQAAQSATRGYYEEHWAE